MWVRVCAYVRARVCVCLIACACVYGCVDFFYVNNLVVIILFSS